MQCEIRAFTKESLEKINLRTANLIRDYGFLPKRSAHIEDGAQLPMKFEPFPSDLLGKPIEELDQFVYEKVSIILQILHVPRRLSRVTFIIMSCLGPNSSSS